MKRFLVLLCLAAAALGADQARPEGYPAGDAKRAAAEEALAAVEQIFRQVSEISGLEIKQPVRSAVVSRDEIRGYVRERLKQTTTPEQLHAQQVALQKFGLLPKGFQLDKFVVDLLAEQATAYYDPRRKQFFLSDWAPLELQKPAIAHELMHALQDQHFDLDKVLLAKGISQDEQMARVAVVEGQGVLVMMDYMLGARGEKTRDYPNLSEYVAQATLDETSKFPIFAAAPAYLRESLLFPYTLGLNYVRTLVEKKGKEAYAEMLRVPPRSTGEVLHPGAPSGPTFELSAPPVPENARKGFRKLDSNVLGELDLTVLLKQFVGQEEARAIAPGWRGLRYDVYENDAGDVILAHRSVWKDAATAKAFAAAYRKVVAAKGGQADTRDELRGDTVDFIEGARSPAPAPKP